jgi:hypothetical protein
MRLSGSVLRADDGDARDAQTFAVTPAWWFGGPPDDGGVVRHGVVVPARTESVRIAVRRTADSPH